MLETQIRPAHPGDTDRIARLLVDLYEAEMPGMMAGAPKLRRVELVRRLVAGNPAVVRDGLVLTQGEVLLGYGAMSLSARQRCPANPADVLREARAMFGSRRGAAFAWGYFRFQALVCAPLSAGTAQLHSLVIDPAARDAGHGERLFLAMERRARDTHHRIALLYVLAGNRAQSLYERAGYLVVPTPSAGGPRRWLRHPGVAMAKRLEMHADVSVQDAPAPVATR